MNKTPTQEAAASQMSNMQQVEPVVESEPPSMQANVRSVTGDDNVEQPGSNSRTNLIFNGRLPITHRATGAPARQSLELHHGKSLPSFFALFHDEIFPDVNHRPVPNAQTYVDISVAFLLIQTISITLSNCCLKEANTLVRSKQSSQCRRGPWTLREHV